jgi:ribosomal protein S18 acetylase RimI-like enzyme
MSVTTYFLEMTSPAQLNRAETCAELDLRECETPQYALNRELYARVGGPWQWHDKLSWTDEQWRAYVESDQLRTWVVCCRGQIAGYFELRKQADDEVEIAYFGLVGEFIGRGFGGDLLTRAIESAWRWGARRVWVHTCTLDHPAALANYRARGMHVYREERSP